jgi:protein ImuA
VLWRRPGQRASATAAPLRLALAPAQGRLAVRILKRRGGELAQPVVLDLAREPGAPLYPLSGGMPVMRRVPAAPRDGAVAEQPSAARFIA